MAREKSLDRPCALRHYEPDNRRGGVRMPAIRSNVIVDSDAFRANRAAHLELIAEFRALEAKVREASGRSDA